MIVSGPKGLQSKVGENPPSSEDFCFLSPNQNSAQGRDFEMAERVNSNSKCLVSDYLSANYILSQFLLE
jgi:hypothetical protein